MIRKVPNHGLPGWLEIQFFYNGLQLNTMMMIDVAAGGVLMRKDRDKAYELLEEMASNDYQWQTEREMPKKIAGMHGSNDITIIHVQLASLIKRWEPSINNHNHQRRNELRDYNGATCYK